MPPAVIAGGVAAVGTIGGAILGSNAQKKASQQANDSQQAATQAQLQLGQQSLAVQQQLAQQSMALQEKLSGQSMAANLGIYNSNYDLLSPFVSRGNVAGDAINALLGLPTAPAMTSPMKNGIPTFPGVNAPLPGAPATPAPGTPATPAPAAPMTLDQWYTAALNSLLPNITQADNIAAINAAPTPEAKLAAALAISPPSSDQYPAYAAFIQANPKPTAAAPAPAPVPQPAPGGTPVTNAVVAQQPVAAAPGGYPRMSDFMGPNGFDLAAYSAARDAHTPTGAAPVPANNPTAAVPGVPQADRGDRPVYSDFASGGDYIDALRAWRTTPGATPPAGGAAPGATPGAPAAPASSPQQSAFEQFANSAGMQFQLDQGMNVIENSAAGRGALQSGATLKALQDYGQQTAIQNYFMPYMQLLGGQQATGAQAGSAVAGVGSSFANTAAGINSGAANAATGINSGLANATTGINAGMGGAIGQGANAAAQNYYNQGAANAGMWGSIGGALGNFAGSMFPSGGY